MIAWLVGIVVVLGALTAAGALGYRWTQEQYYVGIDDGYVAIFRGIPQELGGAPLSSVHERTEIAVDDLPAFARQRLEDTIMASSLEEAEAVRRLGRRAFTGPADARVPGEIAAFVDEAAAALGGCDFLVNNVGVFRRIPLDEMSEEALDEAFDVNVKAAVMASRAAVTWPCLSR